MKNEQRTGLIFLSSLCHVLFFSRRSLLSFLMPCAFFVWLLNCLWLVCGAYFNVLLYLCTLIGLLFSERSVFILHCISDRHMQCFLFNDKIVDLDWLRVSLMNSMSKGDWSLMRETVSKFSFVCVHLCTPSFSTVCFDSCDTSTMAVKQSENCIGQRWITEAGIQCDYLLVAGSWARHLSFVIPGPFLGHQKTVCHFT